MSDTGPWRLTNAGWERLELPHASEDMAAFAAPPAIDIDVRMATWDALRAVPYAIRERRRRAVRLENEGMAKSEIAEHMEINVQTLYRDRKDVVRIFREHGLELSLKTHVRNAPNPRNR